jgi:hypothetical protein
MIPHQCQAFRAICLNLPQLAHVERWVPCWRQPYEAYVSRSDRQTQGSHVSDCPGAVDLCRLRPGFQRRRGPVCHVAYVDVKANPDANELARKAAEGIARGFDCGKDAIKIVGTSGRAVELAIRR